MKKTFTLVTLLALTGSFAYASDAEQRPKASFTEHNSTYWNEYYAKEALARTPSSFCNYVIEQLLLSEGATLLDVGCGNGRDTFAFRKAGIHAIGLDASEKAVESNNNFAEKSGFEEKMFFVLDVCNAKEMEKFRETDAVYARFFIHAITEPQEAEFLTFLKQLSPGTKVLLEFRTENDPLQGVSTMAANKVGKTDHYRRFINFQDFCKKISLLGYSLNQTFEGDNLSVAKKVGPDGREIIDNPTLGRIVATKQ